jgi:3-isopropylmalate dehydrogenase
VAAAGLPEDSPIIIEQFPGLDGEVAWDPRPISREGSHRVINFAFDIASRRSQKSGNSQKVTCVDKSNVTKGCRLFRKVFQEVASEYPNLETHEAYIDAFTMWLIRSPEEHDVVVLPNMFGDIATDLASVLQGGLGMAASANIGDKHMLFEPVHGSSPAHAGKNIVNPIATISSVQLMFDNLGSRHADLEANLCADILDRAIAEHLKEGAVVTYDLGGNASTSDVGTAIANRCEAILKETFNN